MSNPVWVDLPFVIRLHDRILDLTGGAPGLRDEGLLRSALDRPRNVHAYRGHVLPEIAASYAFGIAKNHPFIDGNKRTAFVTCGVFLELNGLRLVAGTKDAELRMISLVHAPDPQTFTKWLRDNTIPN